MVSSWSIPVDRYKSGEIITIGQVKLTLNNILQVDINYK